MDKLVRKIGWWRMMHEERPHRVGALEFGVAYGT